MKHLQLSHFARQLGYTSVTYEGLCKGFSAMYIQAVCCKDLDTFKQRLTSLEKYTGSPKKLNADISAARQLVINSEELDTNHQNLLEIPAFFEGIALYLTPEIGREMFHDKFLYQTHDVDISYYVQSKQLETLGGLGCAFKTSNQYNLSELTNYLKAINQELKDKPNVAIDLSANHHSIAVRVLGEDQFELVDTNHLEKMDQCYTSKELAKELNKSFLNETWRDWLIAPKPLIMHTSIYTNNTNSLELETLRETSRLKALTNGKSDADFLMMVALCNDVKTLEGINYDNVDPTIIGNALNTAISANNNDATDYLLGILKSKDINQAYQAIFPAIYFKNYTLAETILALPGFDPKIGSLLTDSESTLHSLTSTKNPTEDTFIFAQQLINLGADLNAQNSYGLTPIFNACLGGNLTLVELFIDNNATLYAQNSLDINVLHAASQSGNKDLIQFFLNKKFTCNQATINNYTPLHFAVLSGNKEAVELLIANGANFDTRTNKGSTALDLACSKNLTELIPSLLAGTTLLRKDLTPDSALAKLITRCDTTIQNDFLKKSLESYLKDRENKADYFNIFNMGIPKLEKLAAAEALLNTLKGNEVNLKPHYAALNDGLLSTIYKRYIQNQPSSQDPVSNPIKEQDSYTCLVTRLNVIRQPSVTSIDNLKNSKQQRLASPTLITTTTNEEEESEIKPNSSPTPFK